MFVRDLQVTKKNMEIYADICYHTYYILNTANWRWLRWNKDLTYLELMKI